MLYSIVGAHLACAPTSEAPPPDPDRAPTIDQFSASADAVAVGERVVLDWTTTAVSFITLAAEPGGPVLISGPPSASFQTSPLTETTRFILTGVADDRQIEASLTVTVGQAASGTPEILQFSVAPNPVRFGEPVTALWQTDGANRVQLFESERALLVTNEQLSLGTFNWMADRARLHFILEAFVGNRRVVSAVDVDVVLPEPIATVRLADGQRTTVSGELAPRSTAVYEIEIDAPSTLVAEVGSPALGQCDTVVRLALANPQRTTVGTTEAIFDPSGGAYRCGRIDPLYTPELSQRVAPGIHRLLVISDSNDAVPFEVTARLYEVGCGNGYVDPGELCDDGNTVDDDRCNQNCEPNVLAPDALRSTFEVGTRLDPFRRIRIIIDEPGRSLTATVTGATSGPCATNTMTGLLPPGGNYAIGHGPFISGCQGINQPTDAYAADLAEGMYDVFVLNPGVDTGPGGPVTVQLGLTSARCGNSITEISAGEACDDANTASGDGCTSSCQFEDSVQTEVEPNNTSGEATGVVIANDGSWTTIAARTQPRGDLDRFAFDVPGGVGLEVRTYDLLGDPSVCNAPDTYVRVFSPEGPIAENDDTSQSLCSSVVIPGPLPAGRYGVSIREVDASVLRNRYFIDVRFTRP